MEDNKVVLLYSGGIDSTVLLYRLVESKYDVYPFFINYGQNSVKGEITAIYKILDEYLKKKLFILNVPEIRNIGKGSLVGEYPKNLGSIEEWYQSEFFPNRNMILISIGAAYCYKIGASKLAIGVVGISYKDTTKIFLSGIERLLNNSLKNIKIIAPFAELPREEVVKESVRLNVPIELTFSCNSSGERHCLLCTSCYEREKALQLRQKLIIR
ncbi:preQ(0) biosynthesis protein QueC [Thermohydrogenium kirishiense]|jgi:7-cyano-7-deazaguanine synthase|uniref:7-cyano-7-deazaguanine synthase n=1 Tax=Thermoanaerobacterium thermosaccharolyticum TaxID=1517 RepID=UPI0010479201|nr:preQ(0) biosynthesis protein QueC [Thermohydrogenium kirishiense]